MPSEGPVQYGLPSRQLASLTASAVVTSGASSASGAALRHALQRPASDLVENETDPDPRQWSPTRSNGGEPAAASARSPRNGTSRTTREACPARATPGNARTTRAAAHTSFIGDPAPPWQRTPSSSRAETLPLIESLQSWKRRSCGDF